MQRSGFLPPSITANQSFGSKASRGHVTFCNETAASDDSIGEGVSFLGSVPVLQPVSLDDTVGKLIDTIHEAAQTSFNSTQDTILQETLNDSGYFEDSYCHPQSPQQPSPHCPVSVNAGQGTSCSQACSCSPGSGMVINVTTNPSFVNNQPSDRGHDDLLMKHIELLVDSTLRDFEVQVERMCHNKLDAFIQRHMQPARRQSSAGPSRADRRPSSGARRQCSARVPS